MMTPRNRPAKVFSGRTTLHVDSVHAPYVLLPVIPEK